MIDYYSRRRGPCMLLLEQACMHARWCVEQLLRFTFNSFGKLVWNEHCRRCDQPTLEKFLASWNAVLVPAS